MAWFVQYGYAAGHEVKRFCKITEAKQQKGEQGRGVRAAVSV